MEEQKNAKEIGTAYVKLEIDSGPLDDLEERINELNAALEKAKGIMIDLAGKEIEIGVHVGGITSKIQSAACARNEDSTDRLTSAKETARNLDNPQTRRLSGRFQQALREAGQGRLDLA